MPSQTPLLDNLSQHHQQIAPLHMQQLFAQDPFRFERFSLEAAGLMLDYSKNRITEKTLEHLIAFAEDKNLLGQIEDLFCGKPLNTTEKRPALHTALRNPDSQPLYVGDINITEEIKQALATMERWVNQLRYRQWLGYAQKPLTHFVHIGIGGSHLGAFMVNEALGSDHKFPHCHFVAGADPIELETVLKKLNPETTLFIVASKTFTTQETLATAKSAKTWLLQAAGTKDISSHFIAITARPENALNEGVSPDLILPLWDWVGGRFSVWSAIGLPVALKIGMQPFKKLLMGAYQMDQHFRTAPLQSNMPVILGLLSFWYTRFFNTQAHAVLPYDYRLRSLPRYLQQLDMESNGKQVQKNGDPVDGLTAPVLFGEIGTNGQHSFHQLLFQGTHLIPCDFIASIHAKAPFEDRAILLAHCLAQSAALMLGKSTETIHDELIRQGYDPKTAATLATHKTIIGNQPSNTILINQLTPETLGALMALYEHKVFVQGVLWNINSFDQWGVELGKSVAEELFSSLTRQERYTHHDASTKGLLNYISDRN